MSTSTKVVELLGAAHLDYTVRCHSTEAHALLVALQVA
jgi:hypothetical protein